MCFLLSGKKHTQTGVVLAALVLSGYLWPSTDVVLILRLHVLTAASVSEWVGCSSWESIVIMVLQVNHF